jgi:hypothetical protein
VLITHDLQQGKTQAATCGITSEYDMLWLRPMSKEPTIGGHCIIEGGRKDVFGRETIVNLQATDTSRDTETRDEPTM